MLTSRYKAVFNHLLDPLARRIAGTGVSPSALTLATPILTSVLCVWLVRSRAILPFCGVMLAVGLLDVLDGAVARAGGRVTRFGAYLDALCDRYVEALVVLAVAAVTGYWALSSVMLTGSMLVSYAKARAAMEAPVSNLEWPDLMERTERGSLYLAGLLGSRLVGWRPWGQDLFWWTLVILSALIYATLVQRVLRAKQLIEARGN